MYFQRRSASRTISGHPSSESGYGEHWALRSRPETPRRSISRNTLNGLETDDETTISATAQPDQNSFHISSAQLKPLIALERLPPEIARRAQKGSIPVAEVRLRPRQQQFSQRI